MQREYYDEHKTKQEMTDEARKHAEEVLAKERASKTGMYDPEERRRIEEELKKIPSKCPREKTDADKRGGVGIPSVELRRNGENEADQDDSENDMDVSDSDVPPAEKLGGNEKHEYLTQPSKNAYDTSGPKAGKIDYSRSVFDDEEISFSCGEHGENAYSEPGRGRKVDLSEQDRNEVETLMTSLVSKCDGGAEGTDAKAMKSMMQNLMDGELDIADAVSQTAERIQNKQEKLAAPKKRSEILEEAQQARKLQQEREMIRRGEELRAEEDALIEELKAGEPHVKEEEQKKSISKNSTAQEKEKPGFSFNPRGLRSSKAEISDILFLKGFFFFFF